MPTPLPTEITLLGGSVLLLLLHIFIQGGLSARQRGLAWGAGARDEGHTPLGKHAGRAQRALDNYKETYPAFIALALALVVTGRQGGTGETGAVLWFAARVLYLPLYLLGVPWIRSGAYGLSLLGLMMMLARLF